MNRIALMNRAGLVLDVGANAGQYVERIRAGGYRGHTVSFEPLADAYSELVERAAGDVFWHVAPRCAIGATRGVTTMNVAGNSWSSSILPMLAMHEEAAPESVYVGDEPVALRRLDEMALPYLELDHHSIYLKIDTQGYEDQALLGAADIMGEVLAIEMELSLVPLYAGQKLMPDMVRMVENLGFVLTETETAYSDPRDGKVLQVDGLFVRPE